MPIDERELPSGLAIANMSINYLPRLAVLEGDMATHDPNTLDSLVHRMERLERTNTRLKIGLGLVSGLLVIVAGYLYLGGVLTGNPKTWSVETLTIEGHVRLMDGKKERGVLGLGRAHEGDKAVTRPFLYFFDETGKTNMSLDEYQMYFQHAKARIGLSVTESGARLEVARMADPQYAQQTTQVVSLIANDRGTELSCDDLKRREIVGLAVGQARPKEAWPPEGPILSLNGRVLTPQALQKLQEK